MTTFFWSFQNNFGLYDRKGNPGMMYLFSVRLVSVC